MSFYPPPQGSQPPQQAAYGAPNAPPPTYAPSPTYPPAPADFQSKGQLPRVGTTTTTTTTSSGGTHSVSESEVKGFAEYISQLLAGDGALTQGAPPRIPISPPANLFNALRDGAVLCHLVNTLKPGAIEGRHIRDAPRNRFEVLVNQRLVL